MFIKITLQIQTKTIKKHEKAYITESDQSVKEMIFFLELKDFKMNSKLHFEVFVKKNIDFYYAFTDSDTVESFNNAESHRIYDYSKSSFDETYYIDSIKKEEDKNYLGFKIIADDYFEGEVLFENTKGGMARGLLIFLIVLPFVFIIALMIICICCCRGLRGNRGVAYGMRMHNMENNANMMYNQQMMMMYNQQINNQQMMNNQQQTNSQQQTNGQQQTNEKEKMNNQPIVYNQEMMYNQQIKNSQQNTNVNKPK